MYRIRPIEENFNFDDDDDDYIDNTKVYTKLRIGWRINSVFNRISILSTFQSSFLKFGIISLIITEIQFFFYIYNTSLMHDMPEAISFFFRILVLKFNNPIYEVLFLVLLFICIIFLFICLFFDFLKSRDSLKELPKQLELIASFLSFFIYSIFSFPVLFSLFNIFECNKDGEESVYSLKYFSTFHLIIIFFSFISFIALFLYSYVYFKYMVNFVPTNNFRFSMNKYNGYEEYIEFLGKIILVLNTFIISEFFDKKVIEVGITAAVAIFLTWRQLIKQPYYCNKCNNYKNTIKTGTSFGAVTLFILELFKINDKIFSFYIVLAVQFIASIFGFYLGEFIRKKKANTVYMNLKKKYSEVNSKREAYTPINDDEEIRSNLSMERIVNDTYLVKRDHIFNNIDDCIHACDFIKYNHEIRSFFLAAKILDECAIQYKKNPMVYIYYWLFLNTMTMAMKNNIELYQYEDCIKQIELFERIQNNILRKVIRLENSVFSKYLVYYILIIRTNNSKDELSDDGENKDKNLNFHENELKKRTINLHVNTLNEITNTFKDLRSINSKDDVHNSVNNIMSLTKRIYETEDSYKTYIQACYMSSDSLLLYNLFLENIMIDYYAVSFYMKVMEENKEKKKKQSLNRASLMRQSRSRSMSENVEVEKLEESKKKNQNNAALKKEKKKQNENKERILGRLQKPVNKFSFLMRFMSTVEYVGMSVGYYYYKTTYSSLKDRLNYILGSSEGPRLMNSITKDVRLLSISHLANNEGVFNETFERLEQSKYYIDVEYIPLLSSVNTLYISDANILNPLGYDLYDDITHENYFQVTLDIQKDLNVILDREYLNNQEDLLNNAYFKYFSENSKGPHEIVYLDSLRYIQESITDVMNYQLYYVIAMISVTLILIGFMSLNAFLPILEKINKSKFCVVQLFRDVPVECVNKIMRFHDRQTKYYLDNYNNIIKNNSDDEEKMKVKKTYIKNKSEIDIYSYIFMTVLSIFFMILPLLSVFIFRAHSIGELELIFVSTKRSYYSQAIQTWAYEMFYMDSDTYRKSEPSAFIFEAMNTLERIEKSINKGSYGGKSVDKYSILNPLTQNTGCIRGTGKEYECENREYDNDFTEKVANSPLDVIMSEYIIKTKDFLNSYNMKYKPLIHSENDSKERLNNLLTDKYIIFHSKIIKEINGHVQKMNEILVDDIIKYIRTTIKYIDVLHIISMIFIPLIYFVYFRKFIKTKLREMETLTIVFSNIPRSVTEKSTKIKLFVRHGTLESAF
ncbi:hypothetical protein BCR32DRAFT_290486 [Anaeromyces robustus]|uniref:Uncharacterized protein n=1 Tax=Anaeromyces robustus TaxID=1754192 RepID=A0A1Y1XIW5_9FUNG|nr:hypothetical protein BCR32DRAFT_290486 [Anaeromyces robustus]|eukprot:ORX85701.1 hypothetical protein BCR32DRAFT_290486 [Anaeromyces robustus]